MIPLSKFKEMLGPEAASMSDAQLERIREGAYEFADIIFHFWLREKNEGQSAGAPPQAI